MYTVTTKPKLNSDKVDLSFQYWIEGVQYTNWEQFMNKLTESNKGIRMLIIMSFACLLFIFVCCVAGIGVAENKERAKPKV